MDFKEFYIKNRMYILINLNIDASILNIFKNHISHFTDAHEERVMAKSSSIERVNEAMQIITKLGVTIDQFLEILKESNNHDSMYDYLKYDINKNYDHRDESDNINYNKSDIPFLIQETGYSQKYVWILNIREYKDIKLIRDGSEYDVETLNELFVNELNCKLLKSPNGYVNRDDIENSLSNIRKKLESETNKVLLVICIMCHGLKNRIILSEGITEEYEIENIYHKLNFNNNNIFKLFIFSCCRGDKGLSSKNQYNNYDETRKISNQPKNSLVCYSTRLGYHSERRDNGTVFINAVSKVIKEHYRSKCLREMQCFIIEEMIKYKNEQIPEFIEYYDYFRFD